MPAEQVAHSLASHGLSGGTWATIGGFVTTWVIAGVGWAYSYGLMAGKVTAQEKQNKLVADSLGRSLDEKTAALQKGLDNNKKALTQMILKISENNDNNIGEIKSWFVDGDHNPRMLTVAQHDHDCTAKQMVITTQLGAIVEKIDNVAKIREMESTRLGKMETTMAELCAILQNGSNACSVNGGCVNIKDKSNKGEKK